MALPVTAFAYTNPAAAVVGATPAQIEQRAPGIILGNLSRFSAAHLATLTNTDMVALFAYTNGSAYSIVSRISPGQGARMASAVNAARSAGTLVGSHIHYVTRGDPTPQPTQYQIDVVTETYLDFLTASPFPPLYQSTAEEQDRAMVETLSLLSETLDAAHTGWLLGYDVAGPIARWAIETFTPSVYDGIGSTIDSAVKGLSEYAVALGTVAAYEGELTGAFSLPTYDFSDGGDYDVMAAMDFGVCDPINGC